jgi:transcriptional regulator with XRE-family HTH domain
MARHGVSQEHLCTVLGLSQSAVSKRLRGVTPFDVNELDLVASYFSMTLVDLVSEAYRAKPMGLSADGIRATGTAGRATGFAPEPGSATGNAGRTGGGTEKRLSFTP